MIPTSPLLGIGRSLVHRRICYGLQRHPLGIPDIQAFVREIKPTVHNVYHQTYLIEDLGSIVFVFVFVF